ncbi:hypothetical protein D0Y65_055156, partial [Glycine soja]
VDLGTSDYFAIDVLLNCLTVLSSEYLGIQQVVFGSSAMIYDLIQEEQESKAAEGVKIGMAGMFGCSCHWQWAEAKSMGMGCDKEFIHLSCTTLPVPTVQHHQALLTWKLGNVGICELGIEKRFMIVLVCLFFTMVTDGTKKPQVSVPTSPPPWKINLQKYAESRALELHSLQSIIENRVNSDYRSQKNKRRRTTVFDNQIARKGCRRKRQKLGIIDKALAKLGLEENHQKKLPRCVHRRYELKKNPENGFCTSGDVTKRLRTHVWHAKWFAMTKLWGYHLPLCLQGRGKGSRALLKKAQTRGACT